MGRGACRPGRGDEKELGGILRAEHQDYIRVSVVSRVSDLSILNSADSCTVSVLSFERWLVKCWITAEQ